VPDRIAQLIDELARQGFAPRAIQENGYLHASAHPLSRPRGRDTAILGLAAGSFKASRDWCPQSDDNWTHPGAAIASFA